MLQPDIYLFFVVFGILNNLVLTMMAYDHSVAICHSLHYSVIINPSSVAAGLGVLLHQYEELSAWDLDPFEIVLQTNTEIPHLIIIIFFFWWSSSSPESCLFWHLHEVVYSATGLLTMIPFHAIPLSSYQIVSPILSISSTVGKYEAFSICGSHLSVVSLFYGTGLGSTSVLQQLHSLGWVWWPRLCTPLSPPWWTLSLQFLGRVVPLHVGTIPGLSLVPYHTIWRPRDPGFLQKKERFPLSLCNQPFPLGMNTTWYFLGNIWYLFCFLKK